MGLQSGASAGRVQSEYIDASDIGMFTNYTYLFNSIENGREKVYRRFLSHVKSVIPSSAK